MTESARLATIRASLAAIAPGQWRRAADADGELLMVAGEMRGELIIAARFEAGASDDEKTFIAAAPDTVRFLLGLVDRAIAALRKSQGRTEERDEPAADQKNYAAECAMKCGEAAFKVFLEEKHGLERPLTDERAAQRVRTLIGVTSRKELNSDAHAAARWRALRDDFASWKRGQR